jgi:hypothetical protein
MTGRFKSVSIALAITLFVSAAALSACWIPTPAMQEMTMGDAGMTASMSPVSLQQGTAGGSCCQLSAVHAPPASLPRVPEDGATSLATTLSTSNLEVSPVALRTEPAKAQPRGSGSALQSTLCVFLI